jgi:sulfur carrier protein
VHVRVNGELRGFDDAVTIERLLELLDVGLDGVAVELNQEIVPRRAHSATLLRDGDEVEIVTLVGGG